MRRLRSLIVPLLLVLAPLAVLVASARTVDAIGHSHDAELRLERVRTQLVGLQVLPWDPGASGLSEMWVHAGSVTLQLRVTSELDALQVAHPQYSLTPLRQAIGRNLAVADSVAERAGPDLGMADLRELVGEQRTTFLAADRELRRAQHAFHARGERLDRRRHLVAVLIVLVLGGCTGIAVYRSRRALRRAGDLAAENAALLAASRDEARSDALTGLGNRRALYDELDDRLAGDVEPFVLAMFDLDDFKELNDRYGHPAGDAALVALAAKLRTIGGAAFRLGGDELCLLVPDADLALAAQRVLVHTHEDVRVTSSLGFAHVPAEAADASAAMRLADSRLYADKRERTPATA